MSPQAGNKAENYFAAWRDSLAGLLGRMTSAAWQIQSAVPPEYVPLVCLRVRVEAGLAGQQSLQLAAADVAELLRLFLGEEVSIAGELDEMQREALEELVRQWAGLAASALKPDFGEVRLQVEFDVSGAAADPAGRLFRISDGERSISARMALDEALSGALAEAAPAAAEPAPPPLPVPPSNADPSARVEELLRQGNLQLLMDVELGVMLRFGCRHATLHEVLDLATGAVLELDREIQEPVDLVLNGRVIARGEVVVVDGNYGLRVAEVASPQQRVNSL